MTAMFVRERERSAFNRAAGDWTRGAVVEPDMGLFGRLEGCPSPGPSGLGTSGGGRLRVHEVPKAASTDAENGCFFTGRPSFIDETWHDNACKTVQAVLILGLCVQYERAAKHSNLDLRCLQWRIS